MADSLHITLVQAPIVWENRNENLARFGALIRRMSGKTNVVALPEMFSTGFSMNVEALADTTDGTTVQTLHTWAKEHQTAVTGSFMAKEENRYYNRAFFITPQGDAFYYNKRHLFSMAGEDKYFTPGTQQTIVSYLGWNICLQVCYDLRFPVWSRNVNKAYDLLIYIANWPEIRIGAWNALLPARAVENLAYVCAVNRTGKDKGEYGGHSVVYSPKGEKIIDAGAEPEIILSATLHKEQLENIRTHFPTWKDADTFILQ
ncbi:MAG: nitrilase family protein [Tannerellaceae bacterium]|jgi:predicted amidohydrolase|nr:nitrilase family protein [Tannerellaceae bacterium]